MNSDRTPKWAMNWGMVCASSSELALRIPYCCNLLSGGIERALRSAEEGLDHPSLPDRRPLALLWLVVRWPVPASSARRPLRDLRSSRYPASDISPPTAPWTMAYRDGSNRASYEQKQQG